MKLASINLRKLVRSPTGSINLGFILREDLLRCSSYLPLGVPNWAVIYTPSVAQATVWRPAVVGRARGGSGGPGNSGEAAATTGGVDGVFGPEIMTTRWLTRGWSGLWHWQWQGLRRCSCPTATGGASQRRQGLSPDLGPFGPDLGRRALLSYWFQGF
jgi:hypothetical protein